MFISRKNMVMYITGIFILIVSIVLLVSSVIKVPVGYVGMVYSSKGLQPNPLQQGWHLVAPYKKVTFYNISLEQAFLSRDKREGSYGDDSFEIPSKDGKLVNVDFEFSYRFDEDKINEIYITFRGKDIETIRDSFIRAKIKAWSAEISSQYTVIDIYGDGRIRLNNEVYKHIKEKFKPYGIIIESANFSRISVDSQTERAIQDNINAKQNLVKTQLEIEKQKIETEIAKKIAEKQKVEIDLKNYELVSKAKAEAEANELRNKTITKEMIELEKIRKWDGKLPMYTGSSNSIINLSN